MVFRCRYCIVFILLIWTVFAADQSLKIGYLTKREDYIPQENQIIKTFETIEDQFIKTSSSAIQVHLYWGVDRLDKDEISQWASDQLGDVIFDSKLDLSPKEAQLSLLNLCQDLKNQTFVESGQVTCWLE